MRLLALALLVVGVAYAHHSPEHKLGYPKFHTGLTHHYDVTINMTAGVPGMHPQVSKSVITGELKIYGKSEQELILQMERLEVSGSLPGVGSKTDQLSLHEDSTLESELEVSTYATYQNGKVPRYSHPVTESLAAQKIRRAILRSLEMYLDEKYLGSRYEKDWPITYNLTRDSPAGKYKSHYVVRVSPYVEFPDFLNVFNISRVDNFEGIPYIAYKTHHNFDKQGCPEVCKKDHIENKYGAGCPAGQEPHHTPIKSSFVQHHNLKLSSRNELLLDTVFTKETHLADVYDQNLEITAETEIRFIKADNQDRPPEPGHDQKFESDLSDLTKEVQEEAWEETCQFPDSSTTISDATRLLEEIADIILEDDIQSEKSKQVTEKLLTLQKSLQRLKQGDFRTIQRSIKSYDELKDADDKDKVMRQIWLDLLPTVGTSESVSFIVALIKENINLRRRGISFWESKSILESLPENIHKPTEQTITELSRLLEVLKDQKSTGYTMFYSSAYMAVARVIHHLCAIPSPVAENHSSEEQQRSLHNMWGLKPKDRKNENSDFDMFLKCPERAANDFIEQVTNLLKRTKDNAKRIIYIEALSRTGLPQVLPTLREYVYGEPHDDLLEGLTHSYIDYLKTSTIYTLHNLVDRSPREVQDLLRPVFFNVTEPPKVRTAALSVIMKSHPTLGLLQHIAEHSWHEPSSEVGSFLTSSFETFGNSSLPCYQITAERIKKVSSQLKRFDTGMHKAKNILSDSWDDLRLFGLENRFDYTPSNESFIPSVMYSSLGYNIDSLKDYIYQYSLNMQGFSSHQIYDGLLKKLGLEPAADIPKSSEKKIFPDMSIKSRDPEPWKFILYQKLFYSSAYYYFDAENFSTKDFQTMLIDLFTHYIKRESDGYSGHLIKVYIPTSFHSKSLFKAVPFPVQFHMKSPVLISLKLKSQKELTSGVGYRVTVNPSVYHSVLYTNEVLNLADCKRVGVYHEQKTVVSYPFVINFFIQENGRFTLGYKFPEMPKTVFSHTSEAGTYAGKNYLEPLPPTEDRKPIETVPARFVYPLKFNFFGLPSLQGSIETEDIQFGTHPLPRTFEETKQFIAQHYLNAGWRRRSIEMARVPDSHIWETDSEVELQVHFWRDYNSKSQGESDANWSEDLDFNDDLYKQDTTAYTAEGQKIYQKFSDSLSHIKDNMKAKLELRARSSVTKRTDLTMEYYHTFGGYLHLLHLNASTISPLNYKPTEFSADYAVGFINKPNEFNYDNKYGQQQGLAIGGLAFCKSTPFLNPSIVAKALFKYKPLDEVLPIQESHQSSIFEPDTHEQCEDDKQNGNWQSASCLKAIREKSIYNHLKLQAIYSKDQSRYVTELGKKIDEAMKLAFFTHRRHSDKTHSQDSSSEEDTTDSFTLEATYIDKLTHEPVVDLSYETSSQAVNFTKISVGKLRPLSSIENIAETYAAAFTNNTYPASCSLTGHYVRTYDMKEYHMPRSTPACTYVLSTHCMDSKKFAVLVKHDPNSSGSKEIQIYLGKDKIVLQASSESSYQIKYNEEDYTLRSYEHKMLNESSLLSAQVHHTSDDSYYIEIHARQTGIKVLYNGAYVKVQVASRYKGELCGLCSEFNGELVREYRGVDRCLYQTGGDFARSAIVGRCTDKRPHFKSMCDNDEVTLWSRRRDDSSEEDSREGSEPTTKRNVVIQRGNQICFSNKPVPVCQNNAKPIVSESRQVDFHCLPKQDVHARKMVTESKRRILGELETKAVDLSESMKVAKMC